MPSSKRRFTFQRTASVTKQIDVCLVAVRRPLLLRKTLESFCETLFPRFNIANFFANIDPVFGNSDDQHATADTIRSFFPDAHITMPETPGFSTAVKNNWLATRSPVIFHMEDDWVINERIDPEEIFSIFESNKSVKQVSLNNFHKNWKYKRGPFHQDWKRKKIFGLNFKIGAPFPCFTTSPSFLDGDFARHAGSLMDSRFDPEKQFYNTKNMPLMDYVKPYKNFIYGEGKPFIITDIGRDWRDERQVTKTFVDGATVWENVQPNAN